MSRFRSLLSLLAPLALCAIFTGCGIGNISTTNTSPMAAITGNVHGGQQPISGAQVYLYAAGTSGYGSAPTSLLNSPGYVTTDADGNFSFNGLYSLTACQTANQLVYLVSVGGNPGAGSNNSNAVLMAALGNCASLSSSTFTYVNEVTTVASVYALQQFMSPGTYNVGTSSTNLVGLQNAFLTVNNLVNLTTGNAYSQLPMLVPGNYRTAPQAQVNSLANILAACVNSASPFTACASLYAAAKPSTGSLPVDTLGAILDIALNPGNSVATLYNLPPPAAAFAPALTAQPNDWTIGLSYFEIGVYNSNSGYYQGSLAYPGNAAIDAAGNVWVAYGAGVQYSTSGPVEWSPLGVISPQDPSVATIANAGPDNYITITPSGNIWFDASYPLSASGVLLNQVSSACAGYGASTVSDGTGTLYVPDSLFCAITQADSVTTGSSSIAGMPVALDAAGHIWGSSGLGTTVEVNEDGSLVSSEPASGWPVEPAPTTSNYGSTAIAIDHEGDAWARYSGGTANAPIKSLVAVSPTGTPLISFGVISLPDSGTNSLAVDGADTVWVPNRTGGVLRFNHNGTLISPATGYWDSAPSLQNYIAIGGNLTPTSIAIDSSGNLWMPSSTYNVLMELVGVAAPVATPLAANLVNNSIGQRP